MQVRTAAVAGSFYPGDSNELSATVAQLMQAAKHTGSAAKAIIAPHAGYIYSGAIAAEAYSAVAANAANIKRVVLLGPAHRLGFNGVATPASESFETPLGLIELDSAALASLTKFTFVGELPQAHALEHSLEVHLPFLQTLLPDFKLVPLVVGDASAEEVATLLELLWGGDETLIVVSSDLSHFHPYELAQQTDSATTRLIEQLDCHLTGEQACGCRPINGLLLLVKQKGLQVTTLCLANSGDTAGSKDRVVGYGAYALN